jgi:glutamine synthetase
MKISAEYVWIDGSNPTKKLRTKNRILDLNAPQDPEKGISFRELSRSIDRSELVLLFKDQNWFQSDNPGGNYPDLENLIVPHWGFDGSSTEQAKTNPSDRPLIPVRATINPLRERSIIVLCEVMNVDGTPHETNTRHRAVAAAEKFKDRECLFGIEQEYNLFEAGTLANIPLGWPERGPAPPQGKYYCGVGADEVHGYEISLEHEEACRDCGLAITGTNAEVMPGQWEFQIGAAPPAQKPDPVSVADQLWLARYLLYRIADRHNAVVKLDPKPLYGEWNGAGAHANFSTKEMRSEDGYEACVAACEALKKSFDDNGFPEIYGAGYKERLLGKLETCSYKEFKYGVADRGASVRIPLHVREGGAGYIEDRRPCANIDPYQVITFMMETACR